MTIVVKPYKKRKLKTDPASVLRRKAYKIALKNPVVAKKKAKAAKAYYKKNKTKLLQKAKLTRIARKRT